MSQSERDLGLVLMERARKLVYRDPDRARSYLVQAASLLRHEDEPRIYGDACELMARIAIATGDHEIARAPLAAARRAYQQAGDFLALARLAGVLEYVDEPRPFESDARAMAEEIAFAIALVESHPEPARDAIYAHVRRRARLDLARRGTATFTPATQRCVDAFALDPLAAAVLFAAAARDLSPDADAAMRRAAGHGQPPRAEFLLECVAPALADTRSTRDARTVIEPLRRAFLLDPAHPGGVKVVAAVRDYLVGRTRPADELMEHVEMPDTDGDVTDVEIEDRAVVFARQRKGRLVIVAPERAVRTAVAASVARTLGRSLLLLSPAHLRQSQLEHVMRLAVRESRLHDAVLALDWSLSPELFAEAAVQSALASHDDVVYFSTHDQRLVEQFLSPPDTLVLTCQPQA